jgi:hypothetical protein
MIFHFFFFFYLSGTANIKPKKDATSYKDAAVAAVG